MVTVSGCCEWSEVLKPQHSVQLDADWRANPGTSLVINGPLRKFALMTKQSCNNINGNASQLLIEKDAFYVDYVVVNCKLQVRWIVFPFIFSVLSSFVVGKASLLKVHETCK